ncbi:ATP-binding protein [Streptomyces sp. NPDC051567]|uniref:ATP-binding protein n=1 Tax=Streptomyces sp. NPDC051567 TaxID=3365660 RepID=UPI00379EBDAB
MESGPSAPAGFGALLLALRTRAGLSQEGLAQAAQVGVRTLADLERGRSTGPQRRTVRAIARGLGLDPAEARSLEQAARAGRPRPRPREHTAPPAPPGPALLALPRDLGDFTAREAGLARLRTLARTATADHPPVVVVSGQPGLGKTAFAVHAAHRLAEHYPDGRFVLDLRGMDPEPLSARDALATLLRALGLAPDAIPATESERALLYRAEVRERRLLLVLDNAADESQIRPLLPGSGPSMVIVTSRHALAGLEAVHHAPLGTLRHQESITLLTRIVGVPRVQREAQAARDLTDLCGHLPLAVRIVGQRLAARPAEQLGKLVGLLAREETRLDTLQAGGLRIRAAFTLSYRRLTPPAQNLFRRASLAAGPDFSPETAAQLAGVPLREAARHAEELADAGLLRPDPAVARYRFHDLLRLFATERAAEQDSPPDLLAARARTADWMLRRATAAALRFDADHSQDAPADDPDPLHGPADQAQARAWLEAERAEWMAALRHAHGTGRHRQVLDTAQAMHWFSDLNQHWEQWAEVFTLSADAARALGSRREEAVHLNYLAWSYSYGIHDHAAALATAGRALEAARDSADRLQEAWALGYRAGALHRLGRAADSIAHLRESLACLTPLTSPQARLAELSVVNLLGRKLRAVGDVEEALTLHRRSAELCRTGMAGQPPDLVAQYHAVARQEIGKDLSAMGRWAEAEAPLREALACFEASRMPAWRESARLDLGVLLRRLRRDDEARATLRAAHEGLVRLKSPLQDQAATELREAQGSHPPTPSPTPAGRA